MLTHADVCRRTSKASVAAALIAAAAAQVLESSQLFSHGRIDAFSLSEVHGRRDFFRMVVF
jgi:hypothetical protein